MEELTSHAMSFTHGLRPAAHNKEANGPRQVQDQSGGGNEDHSLTPVYEAEGPRQMIQNDCRDMGMCLTIKLLPMNYPQTVLSREQVEEIADLMIQEIDQTDPKCGFYPAFNGYSYSFGACEIRVNDEATKVWVLGLLPGWRLSDDTKLKAVELNIPRRNSKDGDWSRGQVYTPNSILPSPSSTHSLSHSPSNPLILSHPRPSEDRVTLNPYQASSIIQESALGSKPTNHFNKVSQIPLCSPVCLPIDSMDPRKKLSGAQKRKLKKILLANKMVPRSLETGVYNLPESSIPGPLGPRVKKPDIAEFSPNTQERATGSDESWASQLPRPSIPGPLGPRVKKPDIAESSPNTQERATGSDESWASQLPRPSIPGPRVKKPDIAKSSPNTQERATGSDESWTSQLRRPSIPGPLGPRVKKPDLPEPYPSTQERATRSDESWASQSPRPSIPGPSKPSVKELGKEPECKWKQLNQAESSSYLPPINEKLKTNLKVAIIPTGYPEVMLSLAQVREFSELILQRVDGLSLTCGINPRFQGFSQQTGGCVITCVDEATKDWVCSVVGDIRLNDNVLLFASTPDMLTRTVKLGGHFQGTVLSPAKLIHRLALMNPEMAEAIKTWIVLGTKQTPKGSYVVFKIPDSHLDELKQRGFSLFYNWGTVKLAVLGGAKSLKVAVQTQENVTASDERDIGTGGCSSQRPPQREFQVETSLHFSAHKIYSSKELRPNPQPQPYTPCPLPQLQEKPGTSKHIWLQGRRNIKRSSEEPIYFSHEDQDDRKRVRWDGGESSYHWQ